MLFSKKIFLFFIVSLLFVGFSSGADVLFPYDSESDGTLEHPFVICSSSDLWNLTNSGPEYFSMNYRLGCNIDLENVEWMPIGDSVDGFKGTFDGDGYRIYNLKIENTNLFPQGLFGVADKASIINLRISGDIDCNYYCGLLVGKITNGVIHNCFADGIVSSTTSNVGGLVGQSVSSEILNSCFVGNVSGDLNVGGIVGHSNYVVNKCYSVGNVTGNRYSGGIIGFGKGFGSVRNSISLVNSVQCVDDVGYIAGFNGSSYALENNYVFEELDLENKQVITVSKSTIWNSMSFFEEQLDFSSNDWKINSGNHYFALPIPNCLKESYQGNAGYLAHEITCESTVTPTPNIDEESTVIPTQTIIPSVTENPTVVPTGTYSIITPTPTITQEPTAIPTPEITGNPTIIPTESPTATIIPTPNPINPPEESESIDTGSGNYQYYPRHATSENNKINFGSSPVVESLVLPEGASGIITLNTKPSVPELFSENIVFEITSSGVNTEKSSEIFFKIPTKQIELEKDVTLCRIVGENVEELETTLIRISGNTACFKAETKELGLFAITYTEKKIVPTSSEIIKKYYPPFRLTAR